VVFEYYVDANFLVDYFLPDSIATISEKTWKNNARNLYADISSKSDSFLMISYESMLEAVGSLGKRLLEKASENHQVPNRYFLLNEMGNILHEITEWEQKGRKDNSIRKKSPMSINTKLYAKALEFCRKYSATDLSSYRNYQGETISKGIGGIDAFHLAYALNRDQPGKIRSFLVSRDKALLKAAQIEKQVIKNL